MLWNILNKKLILKFKFFHNLNDSKVKKEFKAHFLKKKKKKLNFQSLFDFLNFKNFLLRMNYNLNENYKRESVQFQKLISKPQRMQFRPIIRTMSDKM